MNTKEILLGIGDSQVDGPDDFYNLKQIYDLRRTPLIVRPNAPDSYPSPKIRVELPKRLNGFYTKRLDSELIRHLVYVPDDNAPLGWELKYHFTVPTVINVEGDQLYISFGMHYLLKRGGAVQGMQQQLMNRFSSAPHAEPMLDKFEKTDLNLRIIMGKDDAKTIYLVGTETTYQANQANGGYMEITGRQKQSWICDNRHYLKLICVPSDGRGANLSLSKMSADRSKLSFRYSTFTQEFGRWWFNYYYGQLDQSISERQERAAMRGEMIPEPDDTRPKKKSLFDKIFKGKKKP